MTGGHIVILSLIGLIFVFKTVWIAPIPIAFTIGINLLELFVAFLQAYIFTMLTLYSWDLACRSPVIQVKKVTTKKHINLIIK